MRRFAVLIAAALLVAAIAVPAAGFFGGDYAGQIKGDPSTTVNFDLGRNDAGTRKVGQVLTDHIEYSCAASPSGRTDPLEIEGKFRIEHGEFEGKGEAVVVGFDPTGKIRGELLPHRKAKGSIRLFGELAGPSSDCDTGWWDWKAEKTDF